MSIIYNIFSKLVKPLVGTGIGNFKPAYSLYQRIIASRMFKNSIPTNIVTADGFQIEILSKEHKEHIEDISTELLFKGVHEPMTTKIFKQILKPGDIVVDVGANIGYFTLLSSKLVGYRGIVYAFEPDANNMRILLRNAEINHFENIRPYQVAVSNGIGRATFYTSSKECARHSLIKTKEHDNNTVVEVDKIDNIVTGNIKLLKTDTEGNELAVLQGAEKIITNSEDIVLIVEINFEALKACDTQLGTIWRYLVKDLGMKYIYLLNDYKNTIKQISESAAIHFALDSLKPRTKKELGYNLLCSRKEIQL